MQDGISSPHFGISELLLSFLVVSSVPFYSPFHTRRLTGLWFPLCLTKQDHVWLHYQLYLQCSHLLLQKPCPLNIWGITEHSYNATLKPGIKVLFRPSILVLFSEFFSLLYLLCCSSFICMLVTRGACFFCSVIFWYAVKKCLCKNQYNMNGIIKESYTCYTWIHRSPLFPMYDLAHVMNTVATMALNLSSQNLKSLLAMLF